MEKVCSRTACSVRSPAVGCNMECFGCEYQSISERNVVEEKLVQKISNADSRSTILMLWVFPRRYCLTYIDIDISRQSL